MSAFWIGLIVALAAFAVWGVWLMQGRNREVVSEVKVLNSEGEAGTALIVYHPGLETLTGSEFASP